MLYDSSYQSIGGKTKALPLPATNIKVSNNIPKKIYITWSASQSPDVVQV